MGLPDFSRRAVLTEWMDDDDVAFPVFDGCLKDLAKANRLTLGHRPILKFLNELARAGRWPQDRPLELLDVGCGHGDGLRRIGRWVAKHGLAVRLTGLDRNPWAARSARAASERDQPITWITGDLFDHADEADVIVSSLLAHHLDEAQLPAFLAWMEDRARLGWFVNDLLRHPAAYIGFSFLSGIMGWHAFVRHDGPVSIRRAFRPQDWRCLLGEAGIEGARVHSVAPFRLCVSRIKP